MMLITSDVPYNQCKHAEYLVARIVGVTIISAVIPHRLIDITPAAVTARTGARSAP